MADSACLMRSYSQPSEFSRDFSEGESFRALGESVSFGRYMTEPLAWEKFSAFNSNRYLEEAEKYSKPGSVAKMKAYFEAHYRNKAAKKQDVKDEQAGKSVELEVNDVHNCSDYKTPGEKLSDSDESNHEENLDAKEGDQRLEEAECVGHEMSMDSSIQLDGRARRSDELEVNGVHNCSDFETPGENLSDSDESNHEDRKEEGQRLEGTERVGPEMLMECFVQLDETECAVNDIQNCSDFEMPEENLSAVGEQNHEENRDAEEKDHNVSMESCIQIEAQCAEELEDCQLERQQSEELEKVQYVSFTVEMEPSKMNDVQEKLSSKMEKPPNLNTAKSPYSKPSRLPVPSGRILPLNESNKWQSITNTPKMNQPKKVKPQDSNNRRSTYRKPSEIPTLSVKGASLQSSKEGCVTPSKKQTTKDTFIKKLAKGALRRLSPRAEVTRKSTRISQKCAKENQPAPSAKLMKDKPTLNRARMPKDRSAKPQSETGHSFAGDKRSAGLQSTSAENMPSSSSVYKARPYKFTPFNFRTEERAAKRKELLQRRQEETNGKTQQLEKAKPEKASNATKVFHNIGFRAKPTADSDAKNPILDAKTPIRDARTPSHDAKTPSRDAKKIPLAPPLPARQSRPRLSKKCERPGACDGKKELSCNLSTSSSLKTGTQENASPNIL